MNDITWKLLKDATGGSKLLLCKRVLAGYFPLPDSFGNTAECWQIETYTGCGVVGRVHVRPNRQYDHDSVLALDAGPEEVARVALKCHESDFFSRGTQVKVIIVESPTTAGVITVIDPNASPEGVSAPGCMTASGRENVLR